MQLYFHIVTVCQRPRKQPPFPKPRFYAMEEIHVSLTVRLLSAAGELLRYF